MPLSLTEINSLIEALGVKIPGAILEQRAKAEEFKVRREKVAAEAGGKPADWRLKADFDGVLKRAVESAGKQEFDAALKLLDEAGLLLQQPDAPPPPPVAPPQPASPPQPAAAEAKAAPDDQGFQEKWTIAKQVWLGCLETVDRQLDAVRPKMLATADPDFKIIADRGLPALTDNHKTPVMKALFELESGKDAAQKDAALKAVAAIASFRKHLNSFNLIGALDEHSKTAFGVPMTLRKELSKGLSALEQALQPLTAS